MLCTICAWHVTLSGKSRAKVHQLGQPRPTGGNLSTENIQICDCWTSLPHLRSSHAHCQASCPAVKTSLSYHIEALPYVMHFRCPDLLKYILILLDSIDVFYHDSPHVGCQGSNEAPDGALWHQHLSATDATDCAARYDGVGDLAITFFTMDDRW